MDPKKHQVFEALHRVYAGDSMFPAALVLFEAEVEHESVLNKCCLPDSAGAEGVYVKNFIAFTVLSR